MHPDATHSQKTADAMNGELAGDRTKGPGNRVIDAFWIRPGLATRREQTFRVHFLCSLLPKTKTQQTCEMATRVYRMRPCSGGV